jgi:hypothetical protein
MRRTCLRNDCKEELKNSHIGIFPHGLGKILLADGFLLVSLQREPTAGTNCDTTQKKNNYKPFKTIQS